MSRIMHIEQLIDAIVKIELLHKGYLKDTQRQRPLKISTVAVGVEVSAKLYGARRGAPAESQWLRMGNRRGGVAGNAPQSFFLSIIINLLFA